jgi:predicted lipid-binding transport protein (Tim44 family)
MNHESSLAAPRPPAAPNRPNETRTAKTQVARMRATGLLVVGLIAAMALFGSAFSQALSAVVLLFLALAGMCAIVALMDRERRRLRNRRHERITRAIAANFDGARSDAAVEQLALPRGERRAHRGVAARARLR